MTRDRRPDRAHRRRRRSQPRWDAFVVALPARRRFPPLRLAATIIERSFRHRTHYLLTPSAPAASSAYCRSPHVKSLLFGTRARLAAVRASTAASRRRRRAARRRSRTTRRRWRERLGVKHLEMRNSRRAHPDWPTQDLYVTFRKEILPDVEANMLAIPRKQRAMVRKGIEERAAQRDRRTASTASSRCTRTTCTGTARRRCRSAISRRCCACSARDCEVLTVIDADGSRCRAC